jgi:cytochrome c553
MKLFSLFSSVAILVLLSFVPALAQAQVPEKAATCMACHGPNGNSSMPNTPSLAGQNAR